MKNYLIQRMRAKTEGSGADLIIMVSTKAGCAGWSSKYCVGSLINGPFENVYIFRQMMGRTGRKDTIPIKNASKASGECHVVLSVALFEDLLRLMERDENKNKEEKESDLKMVMELMDMFVFERGCINNLLRDKFSNPHEQRDSGGGEEGKCGMCWTCCGVNGIYQHKFSKDALVGVLTANVFASGRATAKEVLECMKENASEIWPGLDSKKTAVDRELLLLQLLTAGIIGYECSLDDGANGRRVRRKVPVELYWAQAGSGRRKKMVHTVKSKWDRFGNKCMV
jgi:hypothetical protein